MDERTEYWIEIAEYDIETAKAMLVSKRFLYVGFMCHQAIEKTIKAYYCSVKKRRSAIHAQSKKFSSAM